MKSLPICFLMTGTVGVIRKSTVAKASAEPGADHLLPLARGRHLAGSDLGGLFEPLGHIVAIPLPSCSEHGVNSGYLLGDCFPDQTGRMGFRQLYLVNFVSQISESVDGALKGRRNFVVGGDRSYQGWGTPKRSGRSSGSGSVSADMAR